MEIPYQYDNPTDEQRHTMLKFMLEKDGRTEDYKNILELLGPPDDILSVCPKRCGKGVKAAVIGCGEAGLASAFELRKTGCDITLFEAGYNIGGRIITNYFDNGRKYFGELGAMRVPVSHETTWHYINLFRLDTVPFVTNNRNCFFYLRGGRALNDPDGYSVMENIYPRYDLRDGERFVPWPRLEEYVVNRYLLTLPAEIRREIIEIKKKYSDMMIERDRINRRMAYEDAGLSQHAISMLGYITLQDEAFFRLGLTEMLQEYYSEDFSYTYYIKDGMINLPLSLYEALCDRITGVYGDISKDELGRVDFRFGLAADGIYGCPDGVILKAREPNSACCFYQKFDYIICTIPFSSLRRMEIEPLFSVQKTQAITELNYEGAQKTFFFLKDRFWEYGPPCRRIAGGSTLTDLPAISVFYPSDHAMPIPGVYNGWTLRPEASPGEPGVLLASYNWSMDSQRLGNEEDALRIDDLMRYMEDIHGLPRGFIYDRLISYKTIMWTHVPFIWGGAAISKPEDKINFSYIVTQPEMDGRVFFAGEHISQKHAWQQGSLQSAMIASNQVAERIKSGSN